VLVGERSLSVAAFVVRHPDENEAAFHRWLLERNSRLQGVAFGIDADGDVYLVGRITLEGVTTRTVDELMGSVAHTADSSFNELLALGFLTSMRKEWDWRVSRGESTRNLDAFRHLLDPPSS
jgi:Putative bacterial sensory transduction regulator